MALKRVEVKRYYYLLNIKDDLIYNKVRIMGEDTIMTTTDRKECILYTTIDEAVQARKEMGIETLNIITYDKKLTQEVVAEKKAAVVRQALLNAM